MAGGGSMAVDAPPWFGGEESAEMRNALAMGVGGMGIPIASDVAGLYADLDTMARKPEERTWLNAGLTGLGLLPFVPGMTVWHGTPHLFDKFDLSKIGSGEGAQAYGHGLYFAEAPGVAKAYRDQLSAQKLRLKDAPEQEFYADTLVDMTAPQSVKDDRDYYSKLLSEGPDAVGKELEGLKEHESVMRRIGETRTADVLAEKSKWLESLPDFESASAGALYEVDLPDEQIAKMLDWDKPLSEQSEGVRDGLRVIGFFDDKGVMPEYATYHANPRGEEIIRAIERRSESKTGATNALRNAGIPGIKYLDQSSRQAGEGTRNFVVFDDELVDIINRHTD